MFLRLKYSDMNNGLIAQASTSIYASVEKVWDALVNPEIIKQYMFGSEAISEWKENSPIIWKGIWQGKTYEDHGFILKLDYGKTLVFSHFSPMTGLPDLLENYHNVTFKLLGNGDFTHITLLQDNNSNEEERKHSQSMWESMLSELKKVLEKDLKLT